MLWAARLREMRECYSTQNTNTAAAHQQFIAAAAAGLGREDDSAVFKVFQKLSGISITQDEERK